MKDNLETSGYEESPKQNPRSANFQQLSEDNTTKDPWVRTRMCFCQPTDPTDCRFHSVKEPGWETCPNLVKAQHNSNMLGRWLWSKSIAGKKKVEAEQDSNSETVAVA